MDVVQLQAHEEQSADGDVVRGDLQWNAVFKVAEHFDVEREFVADLDVVEDIRLAGRVSRDVYHLVRDFVQQAFHWQEILDDRRHQWACAQRRNTEPRLERLPLAVFLR